MCQLNAEVAILQWQNNQYTPAIMQYNSAHFSGFLQRVRIARNAERCTS